MPFRPAAVLAALCALLAGAPAVRAQAPPPPPSRAAVFVDCPGFVPGCDVDFFQTETPWVRFVRDQADADVYVLVAGQPTGGGGRRYELTFAGRRGVFAGRADSLLALTEPAASDDAQRRALLGQLAAGLFGYAARTPAGAALSVAYAPPEAGAPGLEGPPPRDPWNGWVLRLNGNGNFDGQQQVRSSNLNGSFGASRVTDASSYSVRLFARRSASRFELADSTTLRVANHALGTFGVAVWSLSPHWSAGVYGVAERSTFENQDLRVEVGPGVEWNLYPYAEATRRQLRVQYEAGAWASVYADTTIFGRTREAVPFHELEVKAIFAQPWGSLDVGAEWNQFLSRPDKYRAELSGGVEVRVLRGLSLRLNGNAALVRNQINLVRGDASDQDVLTQQRELATGYEYFASVGVSYTFGSVFNPVVNVRFD